MNYNNGLIQRKHAAVQNAGILEEIPDIDPSDFPELKLTLMEEIFLLGLKDKDGYTSLWNDSISIGLRGCIILELWFRRRIQLEPPSMKGKILTARQILIEDDTPTGDAILDEALRHIKETTPLESVSTWIKYLSGDTWNPLKLVYQLRNVKDRIAKNMVEKGILTTEKKNFYVFEITTHPLVDGNIKSEVVRKIQDAVLHKWQNDYHRMSKRVLALIYLASASEVLEEAFSTLSNANYELAMKRVRELLKVNFQKEAFYCKSLEFLWAVVDALNK